MSIEWQIVGDFIPSIPADEWFHSLWPMHRSRVPVVAVLQFRAKSSVSLTRSTPSSVTGLRAGFLLV